MIFKSFGMCGYMQDRLYKYVVDGIEYMIAFMPSVLALFLTIHYHLTLESPLNKESVIVMALLGIQWLIMFILAIHDANKRPDKFIEK